ncbi:MAG: DUF2442 domain-containing protein [Akkermansiaceae bacterium]|nr:DUF2442 domain-containing protein [Akkermansiaceae bacterium]
MSTLIDRPIAGSVRDGKFVIRLSSGTEISFPIAENPRLSGASEAELLAFEFSPNGVHWPALDEDLSIRGLLEGNWGQA